MKYQKQAKVRFFTY